MIEANATKRNTRHLRNHVYIRQGDMGFEPSKIDNIPIFSSVSNIYKDYSQSSIPVQKGLVRNYKDRFIRKAMSNRRINGHAVNEHHGNIDQLYLDNCNRSKSSNLETSSMTYLPVHLYAYEKSNINDAVDDVKLIEDPTKHQKKVFLETTSIENKEVLTFESATNLSATDRPVLLTSNYFKRKQHIRYCIREYSQGSKVFTPTATQVEEEIAKKPQCLPPLGPPPIMHPPPPRQPPLPCCPKKRDKKKKFSALDERCLLMSRRSKRFVGFLQPEHQNLATWHALTARKSKRVLDKASKGYLLQPS